MCLVSQNDMDLSTTILVGAIKAGLVDIDGSSRGHSLRLDGLGRVGDPAVEIVGQIPWYYQ